VGCHTLERVAKSKHDPAGFQAVMKRMAGYANNSHGRASPGAPGRPRPHARLRPDSDKQAAYLATLNQSTGAWPYELKTLPRVRGKGTRVVITEYDLPRRPLMPHDVIVDQDGIVWYSQFDQQFLGRFDPKTLKHAEFAIPVQRPDYPKGTLDLEVDPEGNLWLSHMFQSGIVKFDKKTEKFQAFPLPPGVVNENSQQSMVGPQRWTVDRKVWLNDAGIPGLHRLDMATGKFETWKPYENMKGPHSVYGIYADSKNNIFFMDFGGENVGKIEAVTGKLTLFPTPDAPIQTAPRQDGRAGPRVVRPVASRENRDVRHQDGKIQGVERAHALYRALRRRARQEGQGVDRGHEHRPRAAHGPGDGRVHRIPVAEPDQHPARVRGQLGHAAGVLGGQQPPRCHREGGTAGVRHWTARSSGPFPPSGDARQNDPEKAALRFLALQFYAAAVRRDCPARDGETEPDAARFSGSKRVHPIKNARRSAPGARPEFRGPSPVPRSRAARTRSPWLGPGSRRRWGCT